METFENSRKRAENSKKICSNQPTQPGDLDTPHVPTWDEKHLPPVRLCPYLTTNILLIHLLSLIAIIWICQGRVLWSTILFAVIVGYAGVAAITVGAHKLWAHRSYKAKWQLRLLLVVFQTLTMQGSVWHWVAWHRAHHKHSEKALDPHNATKGFFYAHVGWLLTYDPKRFRMQRETIRMEDVEADPIVMWQDRYYNILALVLSVIVIGVPWLLFGEEIESAFAVCLALRIGIIFNVSSLVNSAAHLYGNKPYDQNIYPGQNKLVAVLAMGEGWHNYHHAFPWDYRASELGDCYKHNLSAKIIDFFADIGWAYDLKTASPEVVAARMKRTGTTSSEE